jgi:hypothetical protein
MSQQEINSSAPARRRGAYSLAAGAAASLVAGETSAAVVHSGPQNISIGQFSSQELDFDGDSNLDIKLKNYVFSGTNYQGASVNFFPGKLVGFTVGSLSYATALGVGTLVDSSNATGSFIGSMAFAGNNPNAQFNNVTDAFVGLTFPIGANNHFGWVRVDVNNAAGSFLIKDWAYESSPGVGIRTAAIPEPSSLAFLAAGAAGVGLLRRARRQAKTE